MWSKSYCSEFGARSQAGVYIIKLVDEIEPQNGLQFDVSIKDEKEVKYVIQISETFLMVPSM